MISLSPTPLKAICGAHLCFFAHHWAESLTGLRNSQVTLPVLDLQKFLRKRKQTILWKRILKVLCDLNLWPQIIHILL